MSSIPIFGLAVVAHLLDALADFRNQLDLDGIYFA